MNRLVAFVCLVMSVVVGLARAADEPTGIEFFEKKIRPVLVRHCYECHSADAKALKGGLLLDALEGIGDQGSGIIGDQGSGIESSDVSRQRDQADHHADHGVGSAVSAR